MDSPIMVASHPKYRFHLLSLAHLPQSKTYMSCAFTQKNRKLAKMLIDLGHEVFFYGSEGSDVLDYCGNSSRLHFVQTHTLADIRRDYGDGDNRFELGYDWTTTNFRHDFSGERKPSWHKFAQACIVSIVDTALPDDFVLCTQGLYHKPIADQVGLTLVCEPGIGYRGSVKAPNWWRAFESQYIMNFTYGSENPGQSMNGTYLDRVIPNYFDPDDIEFSDVKGDYFLYIGRMIARKGVITAMKTCDHLGVKLIMAGQGARVRPDGWIEDEEPTEFQYPPGTWEYVGYADVEKRKSLMAHAKACFVPTEYLECFGGVHVEAMLSGTPVITTNFGVFGDNTFQDGVHGYKCNSMDDFVWAASHLDLLDGSFQIASYAQKFLMDNVAWEYQRWFEDLYNWYLSTTGPGIPGVSRIREKEPRWRECYYS